METLQVNTPNPEKLKMSLSGGHASKAWFQTLRELADTDTPRVAIDSSALVGPDYYRSHLRDYTAAFERHQFPEATWLQRKPDELLDSSATEHILGESDVLLVLGGSTDLLYKRWKKAKVLETMKRVVLEGSVVACGMSAGAMIWFEQGYSDSDQYTSEPNGYWDYRMVDGTGIVDAWATAHYSDIDKYERIRSQVFGHRLTTDQGSWHTAIGIDSSAALVIQDGQMTVVDINPIGYPDPANAYLYSKGERLQVLEPQSRIKLIGNA